MKTLYHVTPYTTWIRAIRRHGLIPSARKRGMFSDSREPRVYLFEDENTAEDGLVNWLIDENPKVRWFAMLAVEVPDSWVSSDPELAGSFFVNKAIPTKNIRLAKKIDGGEPEE